MGINVPDEHDVEVPVVGAVVVLVVRHDPGLGPDPGHRQSGVGAVVLGRLALGELLGGLPAALFLLQPPQRQLPRVLPFHLLDRGYTKKTEILLPCLLSSAYFSESGIARGWNVHFLDEWAKSTALQESMVATVFRVPFE